MDLLILLVTCVTNLLLGLLVLLRDVRRAYARAFGLMSVSIVAWIVSNYVTDHSGHSLEVTSLANRYAFASAFVVVLTGLLFTYYFPVKRDVSIVEKAAVGVFGIMMIALAFTNSVAGEVGFSATGSVMFSVGNLLWVYVFGVVGVMILIARNLLSSKSKKNHLVRRQTNLVLFAFTMSVVSGLLLNIIIPILAENWHTTRYGPLATAFLVSIIAYTIIRHGLFDIRLAAVRGLAYLLSLVTLGGFYYFVAYAVSQTLVMDSATELIGQNPVSVSLVLVLAFLFQPVKHFFDTLTNKVFYKGNYDVNDFIVSLSSKLTESGSLSGLLQQAARGIAETLKTEQAFFLVQYGGLHIASEGTAGFSRLNAKAAQLLDEYFEGQRDEVFLIESIAEDEKPRLYHLLVKHKIAIVLPLRHADVLFGYLFLGEKQSSYYVERDLKVLRTIRDELVIAIQNALSVQEVKDINATLQQRIDEATSELRANNALLQRLDEAKDEFISMASHQLRTPLTSVKGYISMVLEGDAGKISSPQRHLLDEAFASSERMVHLINDFLNVSRLQTGKFMLERRPIDLAKITKEEVEGLRNIARVHGLTLQYRSAARLPLMYIDESKVRQVIMNFIDNAIYYSHEGSAIKIDLAIIDGSAVLEVSDTGIGVPAGEQSHLFSKFFRATNARRQRPDGTGVGLFLSKKVIAAHGGSMVFQSTEGKGSTFGFRLPVKKLSVAPAEESKKLN